MPASAPPPIAALVAAAALIAPPPAGAQPVADGAPLALDEDGQSRGADCAGRDVVIGGSGGRFTLRGGCRSVSVLGSSDIVHAELQAGARVVVSGNNVTLRYVVPDHGAAPTVSVTGADSQAMHDEPSGSAAPLLPGASAPVIGAEPP